MYISSLRGFGAEGYLLRLLFATSKNVLSSEMIVLFFETGENVIYNDPSTAPFSNSQFIFEAIENVSEEEKKTIFFIKASSLLLHPNKSVKIQIKINNKVTESLYRLCVFLSVRAWMMHAIQRQNVDILHNITMHTYPVSFAILFIRLDLD